MIQSSPMLASGDEPDSDERLYNGELAPGASAGNYAIVKTVAAGGFGTVYLAEHRVLGRRAAVKVMHRAMLATPKMRKRFLLEARAANLIDHPNIVNVF